MNNELTTQFANLPMSPYADDAAVADLIKGGFMRRLQFCNSATELAKAGSIKVNNFAVVGSGDDFVDLGPKAEIIPLVFRVCAADFSCSPPKMVFDPTDPLFNEIKAKTDVPNSKCQCGLQFLIWVPATQEFTTMLFGGKSARVEAGNLKNRCASKDSPAKPTALIAKKIEGKENTWFIPQVQAITSDLSPLPSTERVMEEAQKFVSEKSNIKESNFNPAEVEGSADRAR